MVNVYPEAIKHYPQSMQIFIKKVCYRTINGKNALIGIFGQTGSGKSLMALQLMTGIYLFRHGKMPSNEELIEHTFFRARPFMNAMKGLSQNLADENKTLKKGQAWLWDESGVDIGHKDHAGIKNKVLGWLTQTFRNLQQIVFFTTPSISFIDASVRKLLHFYIEAVSIDTKKKVCVAKPLEMQYNVRMDKIYYHNLKVNSSDGYIDEVQFMGVPKVDDELEKLYEINKNEFTGKLNEQILNTLTTIEAKDNRTVLDTLTERQRKIYDLITKESIFKTTDLAKKLGIDPTIVSRQYNYMRRKGINVHELIKVIKNKTQNIEDVQPVTQ